MRIRAFPFHDDVFDFIGNHERVFVVEQNRDKQMRTLLTTELEIDPARLVPILHYDGTPITARFIVKAIADMLSVVTLGAAAQGTSVNQPGRGPPARTRATRPRSRRHA